MIGSIVVQEKCKTLFYILGGCSIAVLVVIIVILIVKFFGKEPNEEKGTVPSAPKELESGFPMNSSLND